jgi:hypothetical protein
VKYLHPKDATYEPTTILQQPPHLNFEKNVTFEGRGHVRVLPYPPYLRVIRTQIIMNGAILFKQFPLSIQHVVN